MKYIYSLNEYSKNDPIPEINSKDRLGIILLGAPGIGKSTFINNNILTKNRNIKTFSTDDVSLTLTKDPNEYRSNSSELNLKRLSMYIESGRSFIYDTTGTQKNNITDIIRLSKQYNYTVLIIQVMGTLDLSIKQINNRERKIPFDYLKNSYDKQYTNMKYFSNLDIDKYYIVYNNDGKYKYMKYDGINMYKRKVDRYIPLNNIREYNKFDFDDFDEEEFESNVYMSIQDIKNITDGKTSIRISKDDIIEFAKLLTDNDILWNSGGKPYNYDRDVLHTSFNSVKGYFYIFVNKRYDDQGYFILNNNINWMNSIEKYKYIDFRL